jgi:hypothetical protein
MNNTCPFNFIFIYVMINDKFVRWNINLHSISRDSSNKNANKLLLRVCLQKVHKINVNHVRWVHCHHGMGRPQVADGGDALQIWREAANILNKQ